MEDPLEIKDSLEILKFVRNRSATLFTMKMLLFTIPIVLITNNIYVHYYHDYSFYWSMEFILNYFAHEQNKWLTAFFSFCGIFCVAYLLETFLLPFLLVLFIGHYKLPMPSTEMANKILLKKYKYNPLILSPYIDKGEFFAEIMFFPITIILWFIYINTIWAYISMILLTIFFFWLFKAINSYFVEYELKSNVNPQ